MGKIHTRKVIDCFSRSQALHVIEGVYRREKNWIAAAETEIPDQLDPVGPYSWFLATVNGQAAGVLRLFYDPPLELPAAFQVSLRQDVDLKKMGQNGRFVEIGRFMILPEYRAKMLVAMRLMGIAVQEVVERNYTHFITDVFQGEPHSPLQFHTRILGFEIIGSHLQGELNCSLTRIILTLDILKAYRRLRDKKNRLYWTLTDGIRGLLDQKLTA